MLFRSVLLIVPPVRVRLPAMVAALPTKRLPPMPAPPVTLSAPVTELVLAVLCVTKRLLVTTVFDPATGLRLRVPVVVPRVLVVPETLIVQSLLVPTTKPVLLLMVKEPFLVSLMSDLKNCVLSRLSSNSELLAVPANLIPEKIGRAHV